MVDDSSDPKVPTVKDLLEDRKALEAVVDAATRAELERWFGLPSFTELEEKGLAPAVEDPDMVKAREQREQAIAAVDPAFLDVLAGRAFREMIPVRRGVELRLKESVSLIDLAHVESMAAAIADPRERELPEQIRDDLNECTPQALLRDLHRSEEEFSKLFDMVDMAAEQRFDIVAEVRDAMKTRWTLPPLDFAPVREARRTYAELKVLRSLSVRPDSDAEPSSGEGLSHEEGLPARSRRSFDVPSPGAPVMDATPRHSRRALPAARGRPHRRRGAAHAERRRDVLRRLPRRVRRL